MILKVPTGTPHAPSISITEPGCSCSSGVITVTSPVGSGYTYSINGSTYQSGTTFKNLAVGTYYVTVKSTTGCGVSASTKAVISISASAARASSLSVVPANNLLSLTPTSVTVFQNPYLTEVNFNIKPSVSGKGSIVLFDFVGRKIATVFEGDLQAGIEKTVLYRINAVQRQPMIYIFTIGDKTIHGKLLPGAF